MDVTELQHLLVTAYETTSLWAFENQGLAGMILGGLVFGSLPFLVNRKMRRQRRLHRLLWGARMRRSRNRLAFERSSIAMAIEDKIWEMEYCGDMTEKSGDEWRKSFANYYQMDELLPRKDQGTVKRSIRNRINKGVHQIKSIIPGGVSKVKVDKTYNPSVEPLSKMKSKFA